MATIELMSRVKTILAVANRYTGQENIHTSDVFVLFGLAAVIYFLINFTLSCIVRGMQAKRKRAALRNRLAA